MGNVVGIDLGTTNSVAGFKFAQVEIVTAEDNSPPERKLTKSMVAWQNNKIVVGQSAYNQLKLAPENVIFSVKRLMGRGFADEVVQQQLSRFGYKITQSSTGTENSLSVWLGDREYSPEDISAEILKTVTENAQAYQSRMGQKGDITNAVITIPAYFNDKQRYATQQAGIKAGLQNIELLAEPTAAAISYGYSPESDDVKTILVYDFGGGTFDSSIITASGNQFIESGKAGDLWLGGEDIDHLLIEFVKNRVAKEEALDDIESLIASMPYYQKVRFVGDLKIAAEKAKIELSYATFASINPSTPLLDEFGMAIPVNVTITREEFEAMILPMVERSVGVCIDAIKYSDYPLELIDVILLVGGSSQIPLVQRKVKEAFGADKVVMHPRPMYAVAEGAAIVAAGLTEKVSTVSRDYFIQLVDEPRYKIIGQGDILPVRKNYTFRTSADGQSLIHFKFFSPDSVSETLDKVNRDEKIGEMWLALDQAYSKQTEVLVTVELDEKNNYLQIVAALKNDPRIKVSCSFSRGGEDEKISQQVEELITELNQANNLTEIGVQKANKIAGEVVREANQIQGGDGKIQADRLQAAKNKLKELEIFASEDHQVAKLYLSDFYFVLEHCPFLLPDEQRIRIIYLTNELQDALAANNISGLQKLVEDARKEHKNLPDAIVPLLLTREAITQAERTNPTHASAMTSKFNQMLNALKRSDGAEADRLWQSLLPDVKRYLNQELPSSSIATGLTK